MIIFIITFFFFIFCLFFLSFFFFFFFFSSRRRHTRFDCDWSSDVCSSDLRARSPGQRSGVLRPQDHLDLAPWQVSQHGTAEGAPGKRDLQSRSEEHTSELQSQSNLVCRLLLEKKKQKKKKRKIRTTSKQIS